MIRHVVMWRMDADRVEAIAERFRALPLAVPGIQAVRVDVDAGRVEGNATLLLTMDLDDWQALDAYWAHPAHGEVASLVHAAATERMTVDFEWEEG